MSSNQISTTSSRTLETEVSCGLIPRTLDDPGYDLMLKNNSSGQQQNRSKAEDPSVKKLRQQKPSCHSTSSRTSQKRRASFQRKNPRTEELPVHLALGMKRPSSAGPRGAAKSQEDSQEPATLRHVLRRCRSRRNQRQKQSGRPMESLKNNEHMSIMCFMKRKHPQLN